jgi:sulfur carrier protein ThiS
VCQKHTAAVARTLCAPPHAPWPPDPRIRAGSCTSKLGGLDYTGLMQVVVHLHAELARLAPDNRGVLTLDVAQGTRVADVLEHFALGTQHRIIVGVNGEAARTDQELVDGARIDLLTPLAGGSAQTRS